MPHWAFTEVEYQEAVTAKHNAQAELTLANTRHKAANERVQREHDADLERRNRQEEARVDCTKREHKAELTETKSKLEAEIECLQSKIKADAANSDNAISQLKAKIVIANDKLGIAKEHAERCKVANTEEERTKLSREIDELKKELQEKKQAHVLANKRIAELEEEKQPLEADKQQLEAEKSKMTQTESRVKELEEANRELEAENARKVKIVKDYDQNSERALRHQKERYQACLAGIARELENINVLMPGFKRPKCAQEKIERILILKRMHYKSLREYAEHQPAATDSSKRQKRCE